MVNEWQKVELYGANNDGTPVRYTIADGVAVSRGDILIFTTGDRTVTSAEAVNSNYVAGIATEEKIANDGTTDITAWTEGDFRVVTSFAGVAGAGVVATSANMVTTSSAMITNSVASGAQILGYLSGTATNGTRANVRLKL